MHGFESRVGTKYLNFVLLAFSNSREKPEIVQGDLYNHNVTSINKNQDEHWNNISISLEIPPATMHMTRSYNGIIRR
jgi:hypothetical protein